jgi:chromosome partitioning protein
MVRRSPYAIAPLQQDAMKTVSFVTQKGGSGKSTTAASVAVAAVQHGHRVFLLELDKQGTLSDWIESRTVEGGPEFERIDATKLDAAMEMLARSGYDLVVVDTPGVDNPATVAAMRAAEDGSTDGVSASGRA